MQQLKTIVHVCILISLYYLFYYIYIGYLQPLPMDGDSWDYHIPIAANFLNGNFLAHPNDINDFIMSWRRPYNMDASLQFIPQWYYPASSEAINAIFILFHIPTFSNIFATIILLLSLWKLGVLFKLTNYYALLFAISICSLNLVLRWLNVVSIDIWVGVWFVLSLILLENPKKSILYFTKLGFTLGMLMGSKYTASYFILVFTVFYFKRLFKFLNIQRIVAFLLPFSIFGLFWYVRNFILTGNPFYPLPVLGFKGPLVFNDTVWEMFLIHPAKMLNAGLGEYHLWLFSVLVGLSMLAYQLMIKKKLVWDSMNRMFLMGSVIFLCFLFFPTSAQEWIMVSSFRYSLPAFILLILGVFLLASKYKREELLGYFVIANMLSTVSMAYYPKLVFAFLPFSLIIFYLLDKRAKI